MTASYSATLQIAFATNNRVMDGLWTQNFVFSLYSVRLTVICNVQTSMSMLQLLNIQSKLDVQTFIDVELYL